MKLLKLICFLFLIYFIRRFIQMYKVVKRLQEQQAQGPQYQQQQTPKSQTGSVVEADYKVVD